MNNYLLDTDICIFWLHDKYNLVDKINQVGAESCYVSEITIAELFFGAYNGKFPEEDSKDVAKVSGAFGIKPAYLVFERFGKEKARLKKAGLIIPEFDILIATTAVHHNLILVTNNTKHMSRIEGIKLENWTKVENNEFIT